MSAWMQLSNIRRSFGSIHALKGVDLNINHGEIIGLVGENGAGKSTLMKIMSGFDDGFEGEFLVDNVPVKLGTPQKAQEQGIAIAQQELSLIPALTVAENIFIGGDHGPTVASLGQLSKMARPFLDEVGLENVSAKTLVNRLSIGERQLVEVARLIAHKPNLLILDEPTAALGESDSNRILEMVKRLKAAGKSVIYVSHRLDEIFKITDRCIILRDGLSQDSVDTKELDTNKLVSMMLGRELHSMFPPRDFSKNNTKNKTIRFEVNSLWPDRTLVPINMKIYAGEILGLAGQLGSGSGEVLAAMAGMHDTQGGSITDCYTQENYLPKNAKQAISKGIAYGSPDRKYDGLFLGRSISENLSSPNLKGISSKGLIQPQKERPLVEDIAKSFTIDLTRLAQEASVLSGGNQQKVALGKWLSISPELILIDEPTRGVDVGARAEIYNKVREIADSGKAVVIASTDLLEISNLPDRVICFYKGCYVSELVGEEINSTNILQAITNPENILLEDAS